MRLAQTWIGRVWHILPKDAVTKGEGMSRALCGALPVGASWWVLKFGGKQAVCSHRPTRTCKRCESILRGENHE